MIKKQSIIYTFFTNLTIVLLASWVLLLFLWSYRLIIQDSNNTLLEYITHLGLADLFWVLVLALCITYILTWLTAKTLKKHFHHFEHYFKNSAEKIVHIQKEGLYYSEFIELADALNIMVEKVVRKERDAQQHKSYLEALLEAQKNMVILLSDGKIVHVNKAFFDFFTVTSLEEFYVKYGDICQLFIVEDGYLGCLYHDNNWQRYLLEHPQMMHKVKIKNGEKVTIFIINAKRIKSNKEEFIVSFTDVTELENERKLFEKAASTDALTGIANRLKFNTILEQQISLAKRYKEPFSLILYDIDDFKKVNDTYGHQMGDRVLQEMTREIADILRESDTFARWGGEEFGIILPQTEEKEAIELAERIRLRVAKMRFGEGFALTCSFGVKMYEGEENSDYLIQAVDMLLYKAKSYGKNRVLA